MSQVSRLGLEERSLTRKLRTAKEPTSHAMVVSEVIEMPTAKSESFGNQGGVGDLDSGENPSGKSCHHVDM